MFSQHKFRRALLRWAVLSNQPHTVVEEDSFQKLISTLNLQAKLISANTLKRDLIAEYEDQKLKLKEFIQVFL